MGFFRNVTILACDNPARLDEAHKGIPCPNMELVALVPHATLKDKLVPKFFGQSSLPGQGWSSQTVQDAAGKATLGWLCPECVLLAAQAAAADPRVAQMAALQAQMDALRAGPVVSVPQFATSASAPAVTAPLTIPANPHLQTANAQQITPGNPGNAPIFAGQQTTHAAHADAPKPPILAAPPLASIPGQPEIVASSYTAPEQQGMSVRVQGDDLQRAQAIIAQANSRPPLAPVAMPVVFDPIAPVVQKP